MYTHPTQPQSQPQPTKPLSLDQALLLHIREKVTFTLDPYQHDLRQSFQRHFAKIGLHHNQQYTLHAIEQYARFPKEPTNDKKQIYELMLKVKDNKNKEIELSYRWFRI